MSSPKRFSILIPMLMLLLISQHTVLLAKKDPKMAEEVVAPVEDAMEQAGNMDETMKEEAVDMEAAAPSAAPAKADASAAVKKVEKAVTPDSHWNEYLPDVKVSKWGSEIRIIVTPSKKMKKDEMLAIQSVKLETEKGEFLGLKTYSPQDTDRIAEFMVNPELLKIDTVKITATSIKDGDWKKVVSVKVSDEAEKKEEMATTSESATPVEEKKPAPAKKGWFW